MIDLDSDAPIPTGLFHCITGFLWMGGTPAYLKRADDVTPSEEIWRFDYIVNLYPWEPYPIFEHQVYTEAKLYDNGFVPDLGVINSLADYVNIVRERGQVLVHCQQGWNRSGLIVALALIKSGMQPVEAINLIRRQRSPSALCNPTFELWLKGCTGGNTW